MIEPVGLELPKLEFSLKKMGDLLFWEGPLMSHFINDRNEDFIFKWSDKSQLLNRWLVFKTTPSLLFDFFAGRINSIDLILLNPDGFVYFIDMDNDLNYQKILLTKTKDIPVDYMPLHDSFYEKETYEPYAHRLYTYLDYHFSRLNKLYKEPEILATLVAETPPVKYRKK